MPEEKSEVSLGHCDVSFVKLPAMKLLVRKVDGAQMSSYRALGDDRLVSGV